MRIKREAITSAGQSVTVSPGSGHSSKTYISIGGVDIAEEEWGDVKQFVEEELNAIDAEKKARIRAIPSSAFKD